MAKTFFNIRKVLVILCLLFLFTGIAHIFWHQEYIYSLPTPVPKSYQEVKLGSYISNTNIIQRDKNKPLLIHFFNPDCPCSKFNVPHFKSLVKKYRDKITFSVVVMNNNTEYTSEKIQGMIGINTPVLFNQNIAKSCGVYSTPQAVIIDRDNKLYFRGNYNKSRYCTDKKSNYAQMALDSLLNGNYDPKFNSFALKAYGCELPKCNKPE